MRLARAVAQLMLVLAPAGFAQYLPGVNHNLTLLGRLHLYHNYANIWGYTDSRGREYALMGTESGTTIIDVTVANAPVQVDFVPGPVAPPYYWREIKTYQNFAYVVSEGISPAQYTGIQVIDLSTLPGAVASVSSVRWPGVNANSASAHTISLDEAGNLYIQGGSATAGMDGSAGGVRIFSLANPAQPAPVGWYSPRYVHDALIHKNILFNCNIFNNGWIDVLDISNRSQPVLITQIIYPRGFSHSADVTADGNYLITTDELRGLTVKFWDIQVLWDNNPANDGNIELVAEYIGDASQVAHNVHVRGRYAYLSHYVEGLKILDVANPRDPAEVAYYDTYPNPGSGYAGNWGVYPYLPSGHILVSDMQTGLYVFKFDTVYAGGVQGKVTNRSTAAALSQVSLHFVEAHKNLTTGADGEYRLRTNSGRHTLIASKLGFVADTLAFDLPAGDVDLSFDFTLQPENTSSVSRAETGAPLQFALRQNRPNPFHQGTQIEYELPRPDAVEVKIYDAQGRWINTLLAGAQAAGRHALNWDGRDHSGALVANGIYFCRLHAGGQLLTRKLLLAR